MSLQNLPKNYSFSNASTMSVSGNGENSTTFIDIELSNELTSQKTLSSTSLQQLDSNVKSESRHQESLLRIFETDDDEENDEDSNMTSQKTRPQAFRKFSLETASITTNHKKANGHRLSLGNENISFFLDNVK